MCWIGNGEVLPREVPASARETLYIARVKQNHFVPLLRSRQRGGEVSRGSIGKEVQYASLNADFAQDAEAAEEAAAEVQPPAAPACSSMQLQEEVASATVEDVRPAEEQQCREAAEA